MRTSTLAALAILVCVGIGCRNSQQAAVYFVKGLALEVRAEDLDEYAEDYYTWALQSDPSWTPALSSRGRIRLRKGDLDGAIADLQRVLHLDPTDDPARKLLERAKDLKSRP